FLVAASMLVLPLGLRAGLAFSLVALAVGRYPSLPQRRGQRRWRFTGGDPRFGIAQVLLGGMAGIGSARIGYSVMAAAFTLYAASVFFGHWLWKRSFVS